MPARTNAAFNVQDLVFIGVFAALLAIFSWISIPTVVPFTLQTFGVFLALTLLGGKRGTLAILVYILLGAVGLPVFSGFTGGFGRLLGTTGGYILGFLATGLLYLLFEKLSGKKSLLREGLVLLLGLLVCYAVGTAWFIFVYGSSTGAVSLGTVLGWCVLPFILPDICKLIFALLLGRRIRRTGLFMSY